MLDILSIGWNCWPVVVSSGGVGKMFCTGVAAAGVHCAVLQFMTSWTTHMIAEGGVQEPPSRRLPLLVLERDEDLIMMMMMMMMIMMLMLTMTRNTSRKTRMKEPTQTASRLRCGLSR